MIKIQNNSNNIQTIASKGNRKTHTYSRINNQEYADKFEMSNNANAQTNVSAKKKHVGKKIAAGILFAGTIVAAALAIHKHNKTQLTGISSAAEKGLAFAKDLRELVLSGNISQEEIQGLVSKHFNGSNIKIHSMSEYFKQKNVGLHAENKAAVTRPLFDNDGKLQSIDIFLPDLDNKNPAEVLNYLDKAAHEFTHVAQYIQNEGKPCEEYMKTDIQGRLLNFLQKNTTDAFTSTMVPNAIKALAIENKIQIKNTENYNKFMDSVSEPITKEKIGKLIGMGSTEKSQKAAINEIFDDFFSDMAKSMENDQNFIDALEKFGGYNGLKSKIKGFCAANFKNEQEAYHAGQLMRQEINNTTGKSTNNDIIHTIMEMCFDALK